MTRTPPGSTAAVWARFRFSVVGSLLSSPPARGALKTAIHDLAGKTWSHPVTGCEVQFSAVTIERWYYTALRRHDDPVGALRRAVRKDCGQVSLAAALAERLGLQYREHPHWSYQLHYDNLAAVVKAEPALGPLRSYPTVRRYMRAHGWVPKPKPSPASDARDSQLRSRVRRRAVASRFPPRIAQGAHAHRGVAAADRPGHPR
jgi:putative transposase